MKSFLKLLTLSGEFKWGEVPRSRKMGIYELKSYFYGVWEK
jgi:hypothetical protein